MASWGLEACTETASAKGGHGMSGPSGPARSSIAYMLSSMPQLGSSGADPVC